MDNPTIFLLLIPLLTTQKNRTRSNFPNLFWNVFYVIENQTQMELLERLKQHLDRNKISIQTFSFDTGIPSGRVYKWLKKPDLKVRLDREDEKLIREYLEFGSVSNKLNEAKEQPVAGSPGTPSPTQQNNCMETLAKAMEVILSQQRTIETLINGRPNVQPNAASA